MSKPPNAAQGGKNHDGTTWTSGGRSGSGGSEPAACLPIVAEAVVVMVAFTYGLLTGGRS